jgi:hypothetical protein
MVLQIILVLASSWRRTEARHKDSVNITVKFMRKALYFNRLEVGFL